MSKKSACSAGDASSIPGSGRSLGGGNGNPLQHSCLENPMDRGAWRAIVQRVAKSWTRLKRLSTHAHTEKDRRGLGEWLEMVDWEKNGNFFE